MEIAKITLILAMLVLETPRLLWGEDWTTTEGKVYREVKVLKAEPDAVSILYRDGGALIPLAKLPLDLQKRFHYDPASARIAAEARAQADAQNAAALQAEKKLALKMKAAMLTKAQALPAPAPPVPDDPLHVSQFDLDKGPNSQPAGAHPYQISDVPKASAEDESDPRHHHGIDPNNP
jgi:hypothetical protein